MGVSFFSPQVSLYPLCLAGSSLHRLGFPSVSLALPFFPPPPPHPPAQCGVLGCEPSRAWGLFHPFHHLVYFAILTSPFTLSVPWEFPAMAAWSVSGYRFWLWTFTLVTIYFFNVCNNDCIFNSLILICLFVFCFFNKPHHVHIYISFIELMPANFLPPEEDPHQQKGRNASGSLRIS